MAEDEHCTKVLSLETGRLLLSKAHSILLNQILGFDAFDLRKEYEKNKMETIAFVSIVFVGVIFSILTLRILCTPIAYIISLFKKTPSKLMFTYGNALAYMIAGFGFAYFVYTDRLESFEIMGKRYSIPTSFLVFLYRLCCILNIVLPTYLPAIYNNLLFVPHPGVLYGDYLVPYRALLSGVRGLNSFLISIGSGMIMRSFLLLSELAVFGYSVWMYIPKFRAQDRICMIMQLVGFGIDVIIFCVEVINIAKYHHAKGHGKMRFDGSRYSDEGELSSGSESTDTGDVFVQPRRR